jgi:hypothetical protein
VFPRYCDRAICQEWRVLEAEAREKKRGLWSMPNALPPWENRRSSGDGSHCASPPPTPPWLSSRFTLALQNLVDQVAPRSSIYARLVLSHRPVED